MKPDGTVELKQQFYRARVPTGPMTTARAAGEWIAPIKLPPWGGG